MRIIVYVVYLIVIIGILYQMLKEKTLHFLSDMLKYIQDKKRKVESWIIKITTNGN